MGLSIEGWTEDAHDWILDEAMLGRRVAGWLREENTDHWTPAHSLALCIWLDGGEDPWEQDAGTAA